MSTHVHDVVVIGGGQAGLAAGHHLARQGRDFTILDAADRPAAAWRERWDSLRLFTPVRHDSLPGEPFPGDPDHYPTRDEVVAYLTGYARDLPVELGRRATSLRRVEDGYVIECGSTTYEAAQVIVATGPFQTPRVPALAAGLDPSVVQLHSSRYRNPASVAGDGRVLVVGGGNTGFQIAEELAATREVHLAVGSRQAPVPQRPFGRDLFSYLTALGLMETTVDSRLGQRLRGREALVGSSPRRARGLGVTMHGRAVAAAGSRVELAGGGELEVGAVVWATGFGTDHSWIDVPVFDAGGFPVHRRGVTAAPGLCFVGLPWMHTRGSALLGWVRHDARHVVDALAEQRARAGSGWRIGVLA